MAKRYREKARLHRQEINRRGLAAAIAFAFKGYSSYEIAEQIVFVMGTIKSVEIMVTIDRVLQYHSEILPEQEI
jgi:uncharacterized membrane protein